ncbi:ribosome maturation factor RimM [Stappia indica]|uniref:ribosome maturation factor RimM n=1 Tax=Stappia indica TaxID=538381 RepID=UPI001CD64150|nr:ribosome maturation factor RimM [Stappia indica]MCA1300293.1 ribosome maturation factor RimM [Stappia indica]
MSAPADRIMIARIGAPHGVRGEVRVKPYGDDPLSFADYGLLETRDGSRRLEVVSARVQKTVVVTRFKGVDDRNAAEALNGEDLFVARDALPELDEDDTFYHADLLGLTAVDADGAVLGTVIALPDFGAGTLVEIKPEAAASYFVPFTQACVPDIDLDAGRITIVPPPAYEDEDGETDEDETSTPAAD